MHYDINILGTDVKLPSVRAASVGEALARARLLYRHINPSLIAAWTLCESIPNATASANSAWDSDKLAELQALDRV